MAQAISLPALPTPHQHHHHYAAPPSQRPSRGAYSPSLLRAESPISAALRAGDDSSFRDARFLLSLLRQCGDLLHGEAEKSPEAERTDIAAARRLAPQLHSLAVRAGHATREPHVACALADLLERLGRGASGRRLLAEGDGEDWKDAVLWNKQVAMLAEAGDWDGAIGAFREMRARGVAADGYACARALHACGRAGRRREGRAVHAHALRAGLVDAHPLVPGFLAGMYAEGADVAAATTVLLRTTGAGVVAWNAVIACCVRLGLVDDALELAGRMARDAETSAVAEPTLATWNTVLSGCARHGRDREALAVVGRMLEQGLSPDAATVSSLLKSVANSGFLGHGTEVHGFFLRHGLAPDAYTGTALVDMYAKCGRLDLAQRVFDGLEHRNLATWNSLVAGHANAGQFDRALELVETMKRHRLDPNVTTWNGLITGYAMNGLSSQAMLLLRQIKAAGVAPNVVSWTSLISGSCHSGDYQGSFTFFSEMQQDGVQPSLVTMLVLLRACAGLALLNKGKELHCFALRRAYDGEVVVSTALVDMYAKAGSLTSAKRVFGRVQGKNLVCCNAMLTGLAVHGQAHEAAALFHDMWRSGLKPDGITFTALLTACRSMGLVTEAWEYFDNMEAKYGVAPTAEHHACMVDLLARRGYLDEAMAFIERSPGEPGASSWGALLTGCAIHGNLDLAESAARHLFRLEPHNSANYLAMMSLYEQHRMFDEAESLKYAMKARGVDARPGWSWTQAGRSVHVFEVDGGSPPHPETPEIYGEMSRLVSQIRMVGYVPDTGCIAYDVPEEEKERLLLCHTEKLAVVYGLIRSDKSRAPVRVVKNTRMCRDCHEVIKHVSALCGRQIILRDASRFHHFVDGKCSCDDYW
ncbi:pentatricopeptide repeat-containing protein At4g01030, mitochondrial [Aegilops tauschii subsp. strangulata]|uniref:DYW domain-containing protein n=2 Tax=Aegilops tauschii subsp. strangulata TaxID=200361 RepID=A0A453A236_AEGTS|nr:pentatricopeptide repeat-containing protein At4g01030, mitochondrial [Aegilops tauschii subsp. strangulata]